MLDISICIPNMIQLCASLVYMSISNFSKIRMRFRMGPYLNQRKSDNRLENEIGKYSIITTYI